jgi:hypothetical protein
MRPFCVPLFAVLERQDWWWRAGTLDRMVFLQLFKIACERDGTAWVSGVALSAYVGANDAGEGYVHEAIVAAYGRLVAAGALEDVSGPTERWHYRIMDFQAFADAADTARSRGRAAGRRWLEKKRNAVSA